MPISSCNSIIRFKHLRLHRHIERRDRLVGDDQLGVERQRPGDGHPLTLPARQLMRIAAHEAARQFHPVEKHANAVHHRPAGERAEIVDRFGHLVGQLHLRVERGERVLKDHLHVEPRLAQLRLVQRHDVLAIEVDLARQGIDQPQDRTPGGGLAATRFTHKAQGLALVDREGEILHRMHIGDRAPEEPALDRKPRGQVLDRQQGPRSCP